MLKDHAQILNTNYCILPVFLFQVPLIIPVLVFLASVFLVFVPIITNPQIEFLFAVVFITAGFIFFIPFVFLKLRFRCTSKYDKTC